MGDVVVNAEKYGLLENLCGSHSASLCHGGQQRAKATHLHETVFQRGGQRSRSGAGIAKLASCHTLQHLFINHLLEGRYVIWTIQELFGHKDVSAIMIDTRFLNHQGRETPCEVSGKLIRISRNQEAGAPR